MFKLKQLPQSYFAIDQTFISLVAAERHWHEMSRAYLAWMPSEMDTSESAETNCTASTLQHWMKCQCGIMWLRREYSIFSGNGSHQHSTWSDTYPPLSSYLFDWHYNSVVLLLQDVKTKASNIWILNSKPSHKGSFPKVSHDSERP